MFRHDRFRSLAGIALVSLLLAGCSGGGDTGGDAGAACDLGFKIGIMTGTVSQGEDEYRGAEAVIEKYGEACIRHVTYPDNFMVEQETMIAQILNLASDTAVKAIVVAQGVPGTMAAIKKVRELRPEMLFLVYEPHEDPHQISQYADVSIAPDNLARGRTIVDLAQRMGASTFVHYSFPRHMSQELLARRAEIMDARAKEHGMALLFVNAPDPTGDQGLPGSQKFILEDVPRQIAQHGKNTAFFSTNCGMQEPLIRAALDGGAIMPEQCCPSPTHGYPGALGIAIPEEDTGDMAAIRDAIAARVEAAGQHGRMATWPVSVGMVAIEALTEVAIRGVRGEIQVDEAAPVEAELEAATGGEIAMEPLGGTDSYYMFLMDSYIF